MIATRLHIKRHSTSTIHRPSLSNVRYSSYRQQRTNRLSTHDTFDIDSNISETSEENQVERRKRKNECLICFMTTNSSSEYKIGKNFKYLIMF